MTQLDKGLTKAQTTPGKAASSLLLQGLLVRVLSVVLKTVTLSDSFSCAWVRKMSPIWLMRVKFTIIS